MGGQNETTRIRYAPYIEQHHGDLIGIYAGHRDYLLSVESPYSGYEDILVEGAFFGSGFVLSSYPSLYDMYGKFMAGLDIEVLFDQVLEDTVNGRVVSDLISAEASILEDDIIENAAPRFEAGLRDMNSVMSSSFVIGRAMMEVGRTKSISRFSADVRGRLLPLATERWKSHLSWNKETIEMYAQILKFYFMAKSEMDIHNLQMHTKNALWPFTVLHFSVEAIGALQAARDVKTDIAGASTAAKALGGAMMGAAAGAQIGASFGAAGGPWGAAIGGVVGLASGLIS